MSKLSEQLERMRKQFGGKTGFGIFVKFTDITEEDKKALKGEKGDKGDKGEKGDAGRDQPSVREVVEQLIPKLSKGEKGDKGKDGRDGKDAKFPDIKTIAIQVKKEINIPSITLEELERKLESRDKKLWERIKGLVAKVAASVGGKGGGAGIEIVDESEIVVAGAGRIVFSGDGVSVTQIANNTVLVTIPGGAGASNILTETIGSTAAGNNVDIDLTDLSQPYTGVLLVIKNGQVLNPSNPMFGWSKTGDIITVLNGATSDEWMIQFTY